MAGRSGSRSGRQGGVSVAQQLALGLVATERVATELVPVRTHGGARPGAGRPKRKAGGPIPHRARPSHRKGDPVHVTLRAVPGAPFLRKEVPEKVIKSALLAQRNRNASSSASAGGEGKAYFQVVHFNVLDNHVHLIVEASDKRTLARGIAGLEVRIARRLNAKLGRNGSLWAGRYHRRDVRTPFEVRAVLRYVLGNARKRHFGERAFADPCSSAPTFDGFSRRPVVFEDELVWPHVAPRTWLLGVGWRAHGLIDPEDAPRSPSSSRKADVRLK